MTFRLVRFALGRTHLRESSPRVMIRRTLIALTFALAPATLHAQASSLSVFAGLAKALPGAEIASDLEYAELYPKGMAMGAQYRYLISTHVSLVLEGARTSSKVDPDSLKKLVDIGNLMVEGGDLVRLRGSVGLAYETNSGKKNLYGKLLLSYFKSTPADAVLESMETGERFVQEFLSVSDIGITAGMGVEIPVKPGFALTTGIDLDVAPSSDLFDPDNTRTLMDLTARAGFVIWF